MLEHGISKEVRHLEAGANQHSNNQEVGEHQMLAVGGHRLNNRLGDGERKPRHNLQIRGVHQPTNRHLLRLNNRRQRNTLSLVVWQRNTLAMVVMISRVP